MKKAIPKLKIQFANANFFPSILVLKEAKTAVTTPPTLVPKVAAKEFSKLICPASKAATIIAIVAVLDCITPVSKAPNPKKTKTPLNPAKSKRERSIIYLKFSKPLLI